eukprot:scaffold16569_cov60-Phaeocystis_antarctica.AAC.6
MPSPSSLSGWGPCRPMRTTPTATAGAALTLTYTLTTPAPTPNRHPYGHGRCGPNPNPSPNPNPNPTLPLTLTLPPNPNRPPVRPRQVRDHRLPGHRVAAAAYCWLLRRCGAVGHALARPGHA